MNLNDDEKAAIASRFLAARRAATGLSDFPGNLPSRLEDAYAIQEFAIASWPREVIGWKVGRVLPPLSEHYGTDRLAGPVFEGHAVERDGAAVMPVFGAGFAAGEAEFLLRIGEAPPAGRRRFTLDEAANLIAAVHVGIEIASSPLGPINDLGPAAVISDFGNNNGLVIGAEIEDWRSSGFEHWEVTTLIDGEVAGSGRASSFPDGAIGAARFLFELASERGMVLEPGQWISSGAVTGVHQARPGQRVEARFGADYIVACSLVAAEAR